MAEVIKMPALSDTMTEGVLVAWHKKVGDSVKAGELLAEIETDKAVMEFESYFDGTLLHVGVEEGAALPVNAVLAIIGTAGEDIGGLLSGGGAAAVATAASVKEAPVAVGASGVAGAKEAVTGASDGRTKASPLARSIAREQGVPLEGLKGTGEDGRIVKRDVEAFLRQAATASPVLALDAPAAVPVASASSAPVQASGDYHDVPLSQMRKTIARRLSESKFTAPEFYLTMEINMDKAKEVRAQLNGVSPVKISFNDMVIKAAALALQQHPAINAAWLGDRVRYHHYVNMGVAVAVEEGLVVPVVRNAETKSLSQIAREVGTLAQKAKERKLTPEDMSGNTFSISNLGMFGIEQFTAIINPPDACILAVGKIAESVVVKEGAFAIANVMKVTLTCDHRVVDGATGAAFLQTLKKLLEEPLLMLV